MEFNPGYPLHSHLYLSCWRLPAKNTYYSNLCPIKFMAISLTGRPHHPLLHSALLCCSLSSKGCLTLGPLFSLSISISPVTSTITCRYCLTFSIEKKNQSSRNPSSSHNHVYKIICTYSLTFPFCFRKSICLSTIPHSFSQILRLWNNIFFVL